MQKVVDIVVIGGGPAGCAAAVSALNEGSSDVWVIEKEPYGRHRIGEILLTQTILELNKLGVADEISKYAEFHEWGKKYAAAYVHGGDRTPWKVQNNHPLASSEDQPHIPRSFVNPQTNLWYTLMVRRHEFDESLREIAKNKGAKFIHGSVKDMKIIAESDKTKSTITYLEVEEKDGTKMKINAKFIIDATGQQAFIPRKLNERKVVDDWNLQAKYTYFKNVDYDNAMKHGLLKDGANIISFEDGWSWVAHLGKGITSFGIVSKKWDKEENSFFKKMVNLPEYEKFGFAKAKIVDHLGNDVEQDNVYSHPNYRFRSEVMRGKNWACVGDAAMFLDPLLSQGVTLAIAFGNQLGKIANSIVNEEVDNLIALELYEHSYISEIEVLNKVVSQWYHPDFKFDANWASTAKKITNIFGRDIGDDIEAFRWVSNLENIHFMIRDKNDRKFLEELDKVSSVKKIHDFEKYGIA